jgi:phage recombination protein Bet
MSNLIITQAAKLGESFGMEGDGHELLQILKSTAFKGQVSDAQMAALMVVANQYNLNPFTKELYAFPDKNNGIVPVVGVDGWSRIINSHPQFDGIEFEQDAQSCTCIIYRKDRQRCIKVTEWMDECKRGTGPWQSHPRRMLRHKAMIQCARLAFGYGGIYDQDEAERIVESQPVKNMGAAEVVQERPQELPAWPADKWAAALPKMLAGIAQGKSVDDAMAWLRAKATVTPEQEQELRDKAAAQQQAAAPAADTEQLAQALQAAPDLDALYDVASRLDAITDEAQRLRLNDIFDARVAELEQA